MLKLVKFLWWFGFWGWTSAWKAVGMGYEYNECDILTKKNKKSSHHQFEWWKRIENKEEGSNRKIMNEFESIHHEQPCGRYYAAISIKGINFRFSFFEMKTIWLNNYIDFVPAGLGLTTSWAVLIAYCNKSPPPPLDCSIRSAYQLINILFRQSSCLSPTHMKNTWNYTYHATNNCFWPSTISLTHSLYLSLSLSLSVSQPGFLLCQHANISNCASKVR